MKDLYTYIKPLEYVDAHIHLFDHLHNVEQYKKLPNATRVGFMDIAFDCLEEYKNSIPHYKKYIENNLDSNTILLATGISPNNIIDIHKKYPNIIKGFGELKCYDHYVNGELPFGDPFYFEDLYEYDKNLGLPIYIHYNIFNEERAKIFESLLYKYPTIRFVLCHYGMDREHDCSFAFDRVSRMLVEHNNLYVDISFEAAKWFLKHKDCLSNIYKGRVLLGSDISPLLYYGVSNHTYSYKELEELYKISNAKIAFERLFKVKAIDNERLSNTH